MDQFHNESRNDSVNKCAPIPQGKGMEGNGREEEGNGYRDSACVHLGQVPNPKLRKQGRFGFGIRR